MPFQLRGRERRGVAAKGPGMNEVSTGWALILELGFFGWITCTILFIFKAFDEAGNFYSRKALFWGLMIISFYAIWVVGLVKA